jgi:hypothetical protein
VLECIDNGGIAHCPQLEEVVFGEAPVREVGDDALQGDWALEHFEMPASLKKVEAFGLTGTSISSLNASECVFLESVAVGSVPNFIDLILPDRFSGEVYINSTKSIERATFGHVALSVSIEGGCPPVFGEVRFTAFVPPEAEMVLALTRSPLFEVDAFGAARGVMPTAPEGCESKMFATAFVLGETAQLFGRESAPAHPP